MNDRVELDYYYGIQSEQFSFFRVPKILKKDKRFKSLSSDAVLLYSMMIDRMSLSQKNDWFDEENRAYIYYKVENAADDVGISKPTTIKVMKELEDKGLIERCNHGQGRPAMIYVKNFASLEKSDELVKPEAGKMDALQKSKILTSENKVSEPQNIQVMNLQKSNSFTSRDKGNESQEVKNTASNNTNINKTENNDTEKNQSYQYPIEERLAEYQWLHQDTSIDEIDPVKLQDSWYEIVRDNIQYDDLIEEFPYDRDRINEFVRIMVMVICFAKEPYNINGCSIPAKLVRAQFEKLEMRHIRYVLNSFKKTNVSMTAPDSYIVASLFSSYNTIQNEFSQRVNSDMYGKDSIFVKEAREKLDAG